MAAATKSLSQLALTARAGRDPVITGLAVDSREVRDGFLFAALPGTRVHGGEFIQFALRMGASAILTDSEGAAIAARDLGQSQAALVLAQDPRQALSYAAALWFGSAPATIAAVTGTNGKTSVATFLRQIWTELGRQAINLGTTGIEGAWTAPLAHTTPEPITLHKRLAEAAQNGITHVAMEASSHGLAQRRLDAVHLTAAGFTNFTQDHLDYHTDFDDYFAAKAGLFRRVLPEEGVAVINLDDDRGAQMRAIAAARGQRIMTVGHGIGDLSLLNQRFDSTGQDIRYSWDGETRLARLNLIGGFQAENVMMASALAIACGETPEDVFAALPRLETVRGRMQLAATRRNGAAVFVDYAHTPDAVATALQALRPHVMGRLITIIGAGGDRDPGKRILMGQAARDHADIVFVTDDNPRTEDPSTIRAAVLEGVPGATEVGDRAEAILRGVDALEPGDALLIAGKGHEAGQIVGEDILPFDDTEQASIAVAALDGGRAVKLWTYKDAVTATGGTSKTGWAATGVSIDTRTLQPGDLFVALQAARDGHEFVADALAKGAAAALVSRMPEGVAQDAPLLMVDDVQTGLEALGQAGRDRCDARVVAVTGSAGKTSTKEMLATMLAAQGRTHASVASYNNHWGVPLTLARMPADTEFAVIEIGMNHPGEIAPLARMARPHVAMVTTVAAAHLQAFASVDAIAREKASIFDGLEPGGTAIINGDLDTTPLLLEAADGFDIVQFGESEACDWRADNITLMPDATAVQAIAGSQALLYKVRAPGRHFAMNALGALAAVQALGADIANAVVDLTSWVAVAGRGARETVHLDAGKSKHAKLDLIDDAYNANPASMAAALSVLTDSEVQTETGRRTQPRRIAILGDMKELGKAEAELHASIADLPAVAGVDLVYCVGPLMRNLFAALPGEKQGLWSPESDDMVELVSELLQPGDVVLVKGSLSMGMGRIVDAIRNLGHAAPHDDD